MTTVAPAVQAIALPATSQLEYLISQTEPCLLRPLSFFVSWNGVITLAYSGFPPGLAALKAGINDSLTALPQEYSGSKWPKTSLGALHDRGRLTPDQLAALNAICREESAKLSQQEDDQAILVDQLNIVFYECRSLERRLLQHSAPLRAAAPLDPRHPEPEEQARVRGVVAEADDPGYWFLASKDGSRESHYRSPHLGVTLVHDLAPFRPGGAEPAAPAPASPSGRPYGHALPALVRAFRERVDAALPGLYCWFADASLHSTVRSLMG
ncbi:hypothetical protein HYH03_008719 [Edaphochlamys debaryana]|uniref:Uncharacterized protein n=1 Tax=Edaphochlamys debaryana TaxID=47281 RepID=A0A835Y2S6_9CHLO|nr:hypothetical protein HYH03_008719 [Edaphochlamys debaryana]|eukprot:KAG2493056.1 hypothetical protein HYH03_008719 [Edaphochlamys debaryana]